MMTVMTVPEHLMVLLMKIIVMYVIVIVLMIVYKIVLDHGVVVL